MYQCNHFAIHELVPPQVFEARGEKAWELLDERLLTTLDRLRTRFGPVTVNNYYLDSAIVRHSAADSGPYAASASRISCSPYRKYACAEIRSPPCLRT